MKGYSFMSPSARSVAACTLFSALLCLPFAGARAAELQVLAGGGLTGPLTELAARFESASGHKLVIRFGTTPELIKLATAGGPFDLGVVPREVFKDAAAQARFAPGPTTDIARVGLGVAVRAGAARPDIGTPDALRQALLQAQSIASIPESAAGAQVLRVFERLGIGEAMKAKMKAQPTTAALVQAVARGDAEMGVFLSNVLTAPGLDLLGPFPAEVQQEVYYTAAAALGTEQSEAARAFVAFLKSPAAAAVFKARGVTPS